MADTSFWLNSFLEIICEEQLMGRGGSVSGHTVPEKDRHSLKFAVFPSAHLYALIHLEVWSRRHGGVWHHSMGHGRGDANEAKQRHVGKLGKSTQ